MSSLWLAASTSLDTCFYCSSLPAGLPCYILYQYRVEENKTHKQVRKQNIRCATNNGFIG